MRLDMAVLLGARVASFPQRASPKNVSGSRLM